LPDEIRGVLRPRGVVPFECGDGASIRAEGDGEAAQRVESRKGATVGMKFGEDARAVLIAILLAVLKDAGITLATRLAPGPLQ